jgi:hypothetical protein
MILIVHDMLTVISWHIISISHDAFMVIVCVVLIALSAHSAPHVYMMC